MNIIDKAFQTQLTHIQEKTGKSLDQLNALIRASGLTRHAEIRDQYRVNVTRVEEVNKELIGWLRLAYESAG